MADYNHHQHTKLTYFRTLLGELLYYQKIQFAADERQKDKRPAGVPERSFLAHKSKTKTSLSHKSPQHNQGSRHYSVEA